jgi:hypothetical protein
MKRIRNLTTFIDTSIGGSNGIAEFMALQALPIIGKAVGARH